MSIRLKQILIGIMVIQKIVGLDYTENHVVNCGEIPYYSTQENYSYLWTKAILHEIDRYAFLTVCPIVLVLQIIAIIIFFQNEKLIKKPGNIFFGILLFQFTMNIHYLSTAIYYEIFSSYNAMPSSFVVFCNISALYSAFVELLHIIFLFIFPLYIVYILRFTLKPKSAFWKIIYMVTFLAASCLTIGLWYYNMLGLNIYGLCGVSFIRYPSKSLLTPIVFGVLVFVFSVSGFFSIHYFKKHMPNTIGLRIQKFRENKLLVYYVFGYSLYLIAYLIITIIQLVNCEKSNPLPQLLIFITVVNLLRLSQFIFLFVILSKNQHFVHSFKKFWKKLFNNSHGSETVESSQRSVSFFKKHDEQEYVDMFFLNIKQENNQIDMLKISQVVSIVSGIYIAYKQYYNLKQEYFHTNSINMEGQQKVSAQSLYVQHPNKSFQFRSTKKIYYHEKMTTLINYEIIKDYIMDVSLLPQLGILSCTMTIHAPKIFQSLLENDRLDNIFRSFELHENTKKMFALVEGQGGRSGQFFFFSYDNKYVLKTITINQFNFLEENLFYFHQHFKRNADSLLAKIYGLFTFKGNEMQRTYHLILMKNILGCSKNQIVRTYDLKGSKHDRQVNIGDSMQNELSSLTLKDIDFMKMQGMIYVKNQSKVKLREIISKDTIFLKNLNLIDYSLLIIKVKWPQQPRNPHFWHQYQRIPSNNTGEIDTYYHIGIIDYLQSWDLQKKGQKWWKHLIGKKDISAQQPKKYQQRFLSFITQITQEFSFRNYEFQLGNFNHEINKKMKKQIFRFDDEHFTQNMQKLLSYNTKGMKNLVNSNQKQSQKSNEEEMNKNEKDKDKGDDKVEQQIIQQDNESERNASSICYTFFKKDYRVSLKQPPNDGDGNEQQLAVIKQQKIIKDPIQDVIEQQDLEQQKVNQVKIAHIIEDNQQFKLKVSQFS